MTRSRRSGRLAVRPFGPAALRLVALVLAALVPGLPAGAATLRENGAIAYVRGDTNPASIWAVSPDGRGDRRLVDGIDPAWSPDGTRLAYSGLDRTLGPALFVAAADGTARRPLAAIDGPSATPAWSPDGGRIVFSRAGDLWAIASDGSGAGPLTTGPPADTAPSWSADGATIVFERNETIWAIDADGGGARPLGLQGHTPRLSPDGLRLAFERGGVVYVVRADGAGAQEPVSPAAFWSYGPAWSPDGARIAFSAAGDVCTAHTDGTDPRRVTYATEQTITGGSGPVLDWQPAAVPVGGDARFACSRPRWDVSLSVRAHRTRAAVGDDVSFTVVARNRGPDPATGAGFTAVLPVEGELSAVSTVDGTCDVGPERAVRPAFVNCLTRVLFPRDSAVVTIAVRLLGPGPARLTVAMHAPAEPPDTNARNDRATATVVVGGCTITGTTGADVLAGTRERDVICGLAGRDVLRGLGGDDELWDGPGADVVEGGPGDDRLLGGDGDDDLDGGAGDDVAWGGLGRDRLLGGPGDDALRGDDRLGRAESRPPEGFPDDLLDGGPGADVLEGGRGADGLRGGAGDDLVLARDEHRDRIDCGPGRDRLVADRSDRRRRCERVSRR